MKAYNNIKLIPVLLCFFTMGFVDLVGIASNYVKDDLGLTDVQANLFPSLVFFWFLIFSVPTGMLMNKIGRKPTVLVSITLTALSLSMPMLDGSYYTMLISFSLLGIGNAFMQTSLNPLLSLLVSGDKLASSLTFGQFVKAIASFLAPIIASYGAMGGFPVFGLGWRVLFPIYMIVAVFAVLWLGATRIEEPVAEGRVSTVGDCYSLLGRPVVLFAFIGIVCHVGIDVGVNTTAPKLLQDIGHSLEQASFATSIYFIFRTAGCLIGSVALRYMSSRLFFLLSVLLMLASMACLLTGGSKEMLYTGIALVGLGNSNIFSICFSQALLAEPKKQNEVSGLMIMGLFGGALFPLFMGVASDAVGQVGAVAVMSAGVLYLLAYVRKIKIG